MTSLFVAESGKPTLPLQVMRYVENSADAVVAALSVILILFSVLVVATPFDPDNADLIDEELVNLVDTVEFY